jgi:type I restriction enzyme S subunit
MQMSKEKQITPPLRFPEFLNDEAWSEKALNKLADRITDKNKGSVISRVLTNSATDGVVDQRDYFDKDIANQANLEGYSIVDEGDYVYNPRTSTSAPVGPISKNKLGKGVMSPLYTVFRFKDKTNDFFEHYFKSSHWHRYLRRVSNTGARHDRMSITNDAFEAMPLPLPPRDDEQQKIAACLSSIDEVIELEGKKLEALRDHKKGLMQNLFPAEGKNLPKLRFPEFKNDPEWEEQQVGDIFEVTRGYVLSITEVDKKKSHTKPFPVYSSQTKDMGLCGYYSEFLYENAITWTTDGANAGEVNLRDGKFYCTNVCGVLINKQGYANTFAANLLNSVTKKHVSYVGNPKLMNGVMAKIKIPLPPLNEQQKIADCLSIADEFITAQEEKIEKLKEHKKGLMQKLFPNPEELKG